MSKKIYKVMGTWEWQDAKNAGIYAGSAIDLQDGFIHFSTASQVRETVAKHFRGQNNLVLIRFPDDQFGNALKWEPSRGGDLFPHLYGTLDPAKNDGEYLLIDLPDGGHQFPEVF